MANASKPRGTTQPEKREPTAQAGTQPSAEKIAARAFEIWQASGRPQGRDMENWLRAERELRNGKPGSR